MKLKLYQVDAFTNQQFKGNPAAICPLESWLEDDTLQLIAAENNLSETAFFVPVEDYYELRWFTPASEMDLCGHATLATGYVIYELLGSKKEQIRFQSQSGDLYVGRRGEKFCLDFPSRPGKLVSAPEMLQQALNMDLGDVYLARDYLVPLESEDQVRRSEPDLSLIAKLPAEGTIITAPGSDCDFVSRCFFPAVGVSEDPVTGSAHCTLVPYWADKLGKTSFFCRQISQRSGELWCELKGDRVEIAGDCALYLAGEITI